MSECETSPESYNLNLHSKIKMSIMLIYIYWHRDLIFVNRILLFKMIIYSLNQKIIETAVRQEQMFFWVFWGMF